MQSLIETWFSWVHEWGYGGVVLLMAMESSIFPVPSELVVPPAAILAAHGGGGMTVPGVILAGTFGSWLGSAITYWTALLVGRPVVMRFGKYFMMPPHKVERAELFMHRYEGGGIFFARLLPVIRHLISIPAGIIRIRHALVGGHEPARRVRLGVAGGCGGLNRYRVFVLRRLAHLDAESEIDTSSLSALTQKRFELWLVVADRWVQPKRPFKVNGKLDTDELFALWRHELGAKNRGGDLA